MRKYESSIKAHKKQLELAWRLNNVQGERKAYEFLALQYFYLGNLAKAKYYNDRNMRGKCEKKESTIRIIYEDYSQQRSQKYKKNSLTYKKFMQILKDFDLVHKNDSFIAVKKKIISNIYGTSDL